MPPGSAIWYARTVAEGTNVITAFADTDFPDGTLLDETALGGRNLTGRAWLWRARYEPDSGRLLTVTTATGAATLWYVEAPESEAEPPAISLMAFDTGHFAPGTVVDNDVFEPLDVASDQQVGAVRWWPETGQLHEVYVDPWRRRQGIATALIYAAAAHLLASGSPRSVWAGGDRTELGEALAQGLPHPQRVRERRRVLPPMTPPGHAVGVPDRNLFPAP